MDPTTSLEDFLYYKKIEREKEERQRAKKKRKEEQSKKLRLTHDIIKGAIVEIEPKALKIRTTFEDFEMDLWFPKFSIIKGFKEELTISQEFMIKKRMLSSKREDALHERRHHNTTSN